MFLLDGSRHPEISQCFVCHLLEFGPGGGSVGVAKADADPDLTMDPARHQWKKDATNPPEVVGSDVLGHPGSERIRIGAVRAVRRRIKISDVRGADNPAFQYKALNSASGHSGNQRRKG